MARVYRIKMRKVAPYYVGVQVIYVCIWMKTTCGLRTQT
jgi:hypothetical protein